MKRKVVLLFWMAVLAISCAFGFAACSNGPGTDGQNQGQEWTLEAVYARAVDLGYTGSLDEFLALIEGEDGQDGVGIAYVAVNAADELIVTLTDGREINCGNVRGEDGKNGRGISGAFIDKEGNLLLTFTDGTNISCGKVVGADGQDGKEGRGIREVTIDGSGNLVVTYSDGSSATLDKVVGENGQDGKNGVGVEKIYFNSAGELIVKYSDGNEQSCGKIPACTHSYEDWQPVMEVSCLSPGCKKHVCTLCGYTEYSFEEALGHLPEEIAIEPTQHSFWCGRCGLFVQGRHALNDDLECTVCGLSYSLGLEYTLNSDESSYSVAGLGSCTDEEVRIYPLYNGLPVTAIGAQAFEDTHVTSVIIPDGVSTIGDSAFSGCGFLANISIPDTVSWIGDYAFNNCSQLAGVTVPMGVETIGDYTFSNCGIAEIDLPDSITSIGESAFSSCNRLGEVLIPGSVKKIGKSAFSRCFGNIQIILSEGVEEIGDGAFASILMTGRFTVPDSVTSLGASMFSGSNRLTEIILPEGLRQIGDYMFSSCSSLASIQLPNGITSIGRQAFSWCSDLTAIMIPSGVEKIGVDAFSYCRNLTIYCVAASVPEGWSSAWNSDSCPVVWDCQNNDTAADGCIYVVEGGFRYALKDGSATLLQCLSSENTLCVLEEQVFYNGTPYSLTRIAASAFETSMAAGVVIPGGITHIESGAFRDLLWLETVYYAGTEEEWDAISIDSSNTSLLDAARYYYSATEPELNGEGTAYNGEFWRYVDGKPVIWTV